MVDFDMVCGVVQVILANETICAKERYRKCTLNERKARFERKQRCKSGPRQANKLEGARATRCWKMMTNVMKTESNE